MDRKQRNSKYKPSRKEQEAKNLKDSIIPVDETLVNVFCTYVLSSSKKIHKYGLTMLNNLISRLGEDHFDTNQVANLKLKFLKVILQDRLKGIHSKDLLLSAAKREVDVDVLLQDKSLVKEINDEEIKFVEQMISDYLNCSGLYANLRVIRDQIDDLELVEFRQRMPILNKIRASATELLSQFRKNDLAQDTSDTMFRLSNMKENVSDIHREVTSPSFKLRTGMQGLNLMLGGGLEQGNVYCFFGLPGEGKTITIENLLYQVWKYNRGYVCRDVTKRPCIVLLTMENFVRQTVCALYNIITHKNMRDCLTAEEAIREFREHAFEYNDDDNNAIEIVIKFKPVNSVNTEYCNKLIEDLGDEGFEVICFFQDYLKRILPVLRTNDPYQDLGNVTNEFKTIATLNHIPFVTVSQLNREAAKVIDNGRNANKSDLIKKLGRSNIGESSRIDENLDGTFIITPEISSDGQKYMGIKNTKHRYDLQRKDVPFSFYQPFHPDSDIALVEDLYDAEPAYKESLMRNDGMLSGVETFSIHQQVHSMEQMSDPFIPNEGVYASTRNFRSIPASNEEPTYSYNKNNIVEKPTLLQVMEFVNKDCEV